MAIVVMDGFDCYDSLTDLLATSGYTTTASPIPTFQPTGGRFGGASVRVANVASSIALFKNAAVANNTTIYYSFSVKVASLLASSSGRLFGIANASNALLASLNLSSTGAIFVVNASNTVDTTGSTAGVITSGVWARVEVKFNMGTSTSTGTMEVKVNGAVVVSKTGQNFWVSGTAGAYFGLYNVSTGSAGCQCDFDDIVVNDTTGTLNNGYLGDVRIDNLRPTVDTAQADWTLNGAASGFACIDDTLGSSNGDTDYLSSNVVGNKSEFDLGNLSGTSASIMAVQPRVKAERTDAGARTYRAYVKSSAAVANGATLTPATAYAWDLNGIIETDPNTTAAWTDSGVNAAKLGLELVS